MGHEEKQSLKSEIQQPSHILAILCMYLNFGLNEAKGKLIIIRANYRMELGQQRIFI